VEPFAEPSGDPAEWFGGGPDRPGGEEGDPVTPDPVDAILDAIRSLGDGPEPAPDDRLAAFLAERFARPLPLREAAPDAG
jgi:hypothetical protein